MKDSDGFELKDKAKYVVSQGSRMMMAHAVRIDSSIAGPGVWKINGLQSLGFLCPETIIAMGWKIQRWSRWRVEHGRATLLEQLADIEEEAKQHREALSRLYDRAGELLFAGQTADSLDQITDWVFNGQGSAEEILEGVKAGS